MVKKAKTSRRSSVAKKCSECGAGREFVNLPFGVTLHATLNDWSDVFITVNGKTKKLTQAERDDIATIICVDGYW